MGRRAACPTWPFGVVSLPPDLGIAAGALRIRSGVVVLSILDAEVSGGAAGIHDGRDGDAGLAPVPLGGSRLAPRRPGVTIFDQAQLDGPRRAGRRDVSLRAGGAVGRGDRVPTL